MCKGVTSQWYYEHLYPCIEIAARSNPNFHVIILMNSTKLDITANNATYQLYQSRISLHLDFYSISDWDLVVKNTPLGELYESFVHKRALVKYQS